MLMRSSGSNTFFSASRTSSSFTTSMGLLRVLGLAGDEAEPAQQGMAVQVPADAEHLGREDALVVRVPVVAGHLAQVELPAHRHPEELLLLLWLLFHGALLLLVASDAAALVALLEAVLQGMPGEGGALHPHRKLGHPLERLQVAQLGRRLSLRLGQHLGEERVQAARLLHLFPNDYLGEHRARGLADGAAAPATTHPPHP